MKKNILTWDLGATKAAAALVAYCPESQHFNCLKQTALKLSETQSLRDLIEQLETRLAFNMHEADAICIGAAGHFDGRELSHTNPYPFAMPFAQLAADLKWPAFNVIHDYAPVVCATFTPYMQQEGNVKWLNQPDGSLSARGRRVALGIGTGLGLKDGVLFPNGDFWLGQNEAGHMGITMPPTSDHIRLSRHQALLHFLHLQHQPMTFEAILSGQGLARLQQFFYPEANLTTPEEAGVALTAGKSPEVAAAFAWYAGLFVGSVQLNFMPESGVWITGGVARTHLSLFDHPEFAAGINASPAYLAQRATYPLGVLCNEQHAFIGGAYYAVKRLLGS